MIYNYLQDIKKQFEYYKSLGEKTIAQVDDKDLFWQYNDESNSIAIIANHLAGNMLSRWTDFLDSDGEKEWRNRDQEFESIINNRQELLKKWNSGWDCLFSALDSINDSNITSVVYIRNQKHTIPEAINRQLAHYASHVGQIIFIGKMLKGKEWQSLSIPKGGSSAFNEERFARGEHGGHFSDNEDQ